MDDNTVFMILDEEEGQIVGPMLPHCSVPPSLDQIEAWTWQGYCEATDGCSVEPDGYCPHGHPSWLIELGLI